jgi:organic hydroperoxide reductase OsmC/OhrA
MDLPIEFNSNITSASGLNSSWISMSKNGSITTDVPSEFGGSGQGFSPEDLFALSLGNCFLGTFKVVAQNSKLNYESINISVRLIVDKNNEYGPIMNEAFLAIELLGCDHLDRAERILKKVSQTGMILNSVRTKLNFYYKYL